MVTRRCAAFTLIELMVVLAIVGVLLSIAVPRYYGSVDRAREAVLRENLFQLRDAIGKYYADRGRYPDTLESLSSGRYLRAIPADPITGSPGTWVVVAPADADQGGVFDVRSGASGRAADGSEFSTW